MRRAGSEPGLSGAPRAPGDPGLRTAGAHARSPGTVCSPRGGCRGSPLGPPQPAVADSSSPLRGHATPPARLPPRSTSCRAGDRAGRWRLPPLSFGVRRFGARRAPREHTRRGSGGRLTHIPAGGDSLRPPRRRVRRGRWFGTNETLPQLSALSVSAFPSWAAQTSQAIRHPSGCRTQTPATPKRQRKRSKPNGLRNSRNTRDHPLDRVDRLLRPKSLTPRLRVAMPSFRRPANCRDARGAVDVRRDQRLRASRDGYVAALSRRGVFEEP